MTQRRMTQNQGRRRVFKLALAALAIMLMILPFVVSLNDLMTKIVERQGWYQWVQDVVVPWEVRLVGVLVSALGINFVAYTDGFSANGTFARLSWNCLGWQSLLLYLVTLPVGFRGGSYTWLSKLEAFLIGLLGTFFANLFRITFTVILLVISRPLYAIVFHDYLAAIVTVVWLVIFWWFAYGYVLEEKMVQPRPKKDSRLQDLFKQKRVKNRDTKI